MAVPWAVEANKRFASYVDACLDRTGPNVQLLLATLRDAAASDRPDILLSGIDIMEAIAGLVTERSSLRECLSRIPC